MKGSGPGGLKLRTKLLLVVGASLVTLAALVVGSAVIDVGRSRDLTDLEGRLVPKLELGPQIESEFGRLGQELQDAVSAEDSAALDATVQTRDRLIRLLTGKTGALTSEDAASLRWSVHAFHEMAIGVSRRMLEGETGEVLVADIARMQALRAQTLGRIKATTSLDKAALASAFSAVKTEGERANRFRLGLGFGGLALVLALSWWATQSALRVLGDLSRGFVRFGSGDLSQPIPITTGDELGEVAREANEMAARLKTLSDHRDRADWLKEGQAGLSEELRGEHDPADVARRSLWFLARRVGACAGAIYLKGETGAFDLAATYALGAPDAKAGHELEARPSFRPGESLVGQAALAEDIVVVHEPPPGYLTIRSGLGEAAPRAIVLFPLRHAGESVGVIELALLEKYSDDVSALLASVRQMLVVSHLAAVSREGLRVLLKRTQEQAERLTAQEEELRLNNQELHLQQDGLRTANEELEAQRGALSDKNRELEETRRRVQEKADELGRMSTYKSQFLANMSHELRTPLNSMLLLSHLLAENEGKNLTPKQVEHCRTVHAAGEDLLTLINQILDLAKIEAGRQEVFLEKVDLRGLEAHLRRVFEPLAAAKKLQLVVDIEQGVPAAITTDRERLQRILTNLLGNAVKFTDTGQVTLRVARPSREARIARPDLAVGKALAFSVSDTGIGIAGDALEKIFAPFEQLESHTKRRYAGTGLGLAIARDSANLIGGELQVTSEPGRGSTFTCYLPDRLQAQPPAVARAARHQPQDDRASLAEGEPYLLVVEDDPVLGEQLLDIIRSRGLKALIATTGEEGLRAARTQRPKGIVLDVKLPDLDGWTLMERLAQDPATRTIPVHFVSGVDAPERGLSLGAIGYLTKPASHAELVNLVRALAPASGKESSRVLVVEDSVDQGQAIVALLAKEGFDARHVATAADALTELSGPAYGCIVLDLGLPDMDGLALLETLRRRSGAEMPRVLVHTGRSLTRLETRELEAYAQAVILKSERSGERLLEELRLFVRHVDGGGEAKRTVPGDEGEADRSLAGVKVLVAEDDMRTVYALSALLRGKGAEVLVAETGREALDVLHKNSGLHAVLMDVMMPEMDGYEAIRQLRQDPRFRDLPVVALTAKAMKGERERCLEAGATEYLSKPIDGTRLLATVGGLVRGRGQSGS